MSEHQHITGGVDEHGRALRIHLSRDHGVEPDTLDDPAEWHREAHCAHTSNEVFATVIEQRADPAEPLRNALRLIDRHGCERLTRGRCFDSGNGWTRGAACYADGWCGPCIAADALRTYAAEATS